ncbi:MAG: hypothetical protein WC758_03070 [Candidatus Woesearchaeota archaeon]
MNKKGDTSFLKWIGGLFGLILIILLMYLIYNKYILPGTEDVGGYLATEDFDGDGFPNGADPCPAGGPNAVNDRPTKQGISQCAMSLTKDAPTLCACANTLANKYAKDESKDPDNYKDQSFFIWTVPDKEGAEKCLYNKNAATNLINQDSDFMRKIIADKNPCEVLMVNG